MDIIEATDATNINKYIKSARASKPSSHMVDADLVSKSVITYNINIPTHFWQALSDIIAITTVVSSITFLEYRVFCMFNGH